MKISFCQRTVSKKTAVVILFSEKGKLFGAGRAFDQQTGGILSKALKQSRLTGDLGELIGVVIPDRLGPDWVLLAGLGKGSLFDALAAEKLGGDIANRLDRQGQERAVVDVEVPGGSKISSHEMAARMANGSVLGCYRFDKYRNKMKASDKPVLKNLAFAVASPAAARKTYASMARVSEGVCMTRDLASEPANILYPETLAEQARTLTDLGVRVKILGPDKMKKLGMGALLGVGQGSARPPRLVVMHWDGASSKNDQPIAFIGKGVTFDTGGISIKPSGGMEDMKWDMGGAGVVIGLMRALAGRKAKVNVVGIIGLAENMPDGNAQRPGDVVQSMSGQSIEVLNTDAEGRLILADALWYCQEQFKPQFMVDLATLTGAIIIALGDNYAGLFSNNDALATRLQKAGQVVDEGVWRLPLGPDYDKLLNSPIADVKNITGQRGAGSITAAQFLQRFVNNVPWAHLDIAGVTWSSKGKAIAPKGATGFGVRLLDRLVADHYEKK